MKSALSFIFLATLARDCSARCRSLAVFAVDTGLSDWSQKGMNNDDVAKTIASTLAGMPTICTWSGSILNTTNQLQSVLSRRVDILFAFATDHQPVWGATERDLVSQAIYARRLGYLAVYDWIPFYAGTERWIPGLPAAAVTPGYSQVFTPVPGGPASNLRTISSYPDGCYLSTGAVSTSTVPNSIPVWTGQPNYPDPTDITAVVEYPHPNSIVPVYYSTTFLWAFLQAPASEQAACGTENATHNPAAEMIAIFASDVAYITAKTPGTGPLPDVPPDVPSDVVITTTCPHIVGTKSWVPATKKFFPITLMRDPADPSNRTLNFTITSCAASEGGKTKKGKDCYIDEDISNLVFVRATKLGNGGRLYRIGYLARDSAGDVCSGVVLACVPNDVNSERARVKPDGKRKSRTCPSPDDFIGNWYEHLAHSHSPEKEKDAKDDSISSGDSTSTSTVAAAWQWNIVVALCATTLVVSVSTLTTICCRLQTSWQAVKEEAAAIPHSLSPYHVRHIPPM